MGAVWPRVVPLYSQRKDPPFVCPLHCIWCPVNYLALRVDTMPTHRMRGASVLVGGGIWDPSCFANTLVQQSCWSGHTLKPPAASI